MQQGDRCLYAGWIRGGSLRSAQRETPACFTQSWHTTYCLTPSQNVSEIIGTFPTRPTLCSFSGSASFFAMQVRQINTNLVVFHFVLCNSIICLESKGVAACSASAIKGDSLFCILPQCLENSHKCFFFNDQGNDSHDIPHRVQIRYNLGLAHSHTCI